MAQVSVAQIQYLLGITAKGQATKANSFPVVLPSDQLGQTTKASSLSVTIATDQLGQAVAGSSLSMVQASSHQFIVVGQGTAGSPAGNVLSVQGVASGTAQPISATSLPLPTGAAIGVAQNTPLGTTAATMVAGAVLTANPTYTTGNIQPISIGTDGGLRIKGLRSNNAAAPTTFDNLGVLNGYATSAIPSFTDGYQVLQSRDLTGNTRVTPLVTDRGGATYIRVLSLASTNGTVVKASIGQVYGWYFYNNATTTKFVKLYNSASVTAGSGTPAITIPVPAGGGTNISWVHGIAFAAGICYTITGAVGDTDTTAVAAADISGWLLWK